MENKEFREYSDYPKKMCAECGKMFTDLYGEQKCDFCLGYH